MWNGNSLENVAVPFSRMPWRRKLYRYVFQIGNPILIQLIFCLAHTVIRI